MSVPSPDGISGDLLQRRLGLTESHARRALSRFRRFWSRYQRIQRTRGGGEQDTADAAWAELTLGSRGGPKHLAAVRCDVARVLSCFAPSIAMHLHPRAGEEAVRFSFLLPAHPRPSLGTV